VFKVKHLYLFLALVLIGGFLYWVYYLLQIRFSIGDIYPPYSSLRSDPLGSKALFASLEALEGVEVERHLGRLSELKDAESTILYLGELPWMAGAATLLKWEEVLPLAQNGNHLTLAFRPSAFFNAASESVLVRIKGDDPEDDEPPEFRLDIFEAQDDSESGEIKDGNVEFLEARRMIEAPLPEVLPWRSKVYFADLAPGWEVVYAVEGRPVVIEKREAGVSAILLTDSYYFSNEALWKARHPNLLAWFMDGRTRIAFEESHLGLNASTNLMGLVRQFGLHGFLIGFTLWGLLFIWHQASSLLPPIDEEKRGTTQGKHAASGLMSLLARGIPANTLLETCFGEWRKNLKAHQPMLQSREAEVEKYLRTASISKKQESLVAQYNQIQRLVTRRRPSK